MHASRFYLGRGILVRVAPNDGVNKGEVDAADQGMIKH
jgi:hypothetical protein